MSDTDYSAIPGILIGDPAERDEYINETGGKAASGSSTFAKFTFKDGFESNLKRANSENINYSSNNIDDSKPESSDAHFKFSDDVKNLNYKIYPFPSELKTFINTGVFYLTEDDFPGFDYEKFLESIPYAQIRAYEPHTVMQFITGFLDTVFRAWELVDNEGLDGAAEAMREKISEMCDDVKLFFTSIRNEESFKAFLTTLGDGISKAYTVRGKEFKVDSKNFNDFAVLDLQYNLYYKIMGSTTNAIYEIPCLFSSESLKSNGNFGWSQNSFNGISKVSSNLGESTSSKDKAAFAILTALASKLNITFQPIFKPDTQTSDPDSFSFSFDLINDTIVHAKSNFAFIQTITGNNKWIQSTIVTRPANLYDIRIPGNFRSLMCTGIFTVTFKGAVRTFTESALNDKEFKQPFGKDFRIPEAYSVNMTFNSLIPSNFNTYMIGMLKSNENLFSFNKGKRVENGVGGLLGEAFSKATDKMGETYKERNNNIYEDLSKKVNFRKRDSNTSNDEKDKAEIEKNNRNVDLYNEDLKKFIQNEIFNNPNVDFNNEQNRNNLIAKAHEFAKIQEKIREEEENIKILKDKIEELENQQQKDEEITKKEKELTDSENRLRNFRKQKFYVEYN